MPVKIGGVLCPSDIFLAPMAGISDSPFRQMCLKGGAGLVVGEMVSACALYYGNKKTGAMLKISPSEHPCAVQIFGGDEKTISTAAKLAAESGADIIDINAGCPVRKIIKSNSGIALMKDEKAFARVVSAAVKSAGVPVMVKIRSGLKKGELLSPRFATIAREEGACAVAVHARPAEMMHSGPVDLSALNKTASAVKIPVIGNGGISCASDAKAMFSAGCAAVMIGRAAIGNPDIFKRITAELKGEIITPENPRVKAKDFFELISANVAFYGEKEGILRSRK
ncbi:MAG: tRNA-dihydrouridine synthase family protein, partial [Elusimicrobia bacterium]|nr:tRNA-dihydrouridine synthase family protein [Elusimicrobiota bacterium]